MTDRHLKRRSVQVLHCVWHRPYAPMFRKYPPSFSLWSLDERYLSGLSQ